MNSLLFINTNPSDICPPSGTHFHFGKGTLQLYSFGLTISYTVC